MRTRADGGLRDGRVARAAALMALAAALTTTTPAHAGPTTRPRDPWVFRSVLDERARMLTCELSDKLIVAYDTQTASVRRAWSGEVLFTGGVYDARHGPQPKSVGPAYYRAALDESPWSVGNGDKTVRTTPHYLGYRLKDNSVSIAYAVDAPGGGRVEVREWPECEIDGPRVTLVRTFRVSGLPDGATLSLDLGGTDGDPPAEQALDFAGETSGHLSPTPQPPRGVLLFDRNGTYRLRTTWSKQ